MSYAKERVKSEMTIAGQVKGRGKAAWVLMVQEAGPGTAQ